MCTEVTRSKKTLEEMDVIDDFLFTEIITDEENGKEVCRMILSLVLKREIGEINYTAQKVVPGISESSHGIRMDAYITEQLSEKGKGKPDVMVYDMEPDTQSKKKKMLPKRSRYYGDLIDAQLLETGVEYDKLPELVTIFILSFDPFGKNAMYYEAGSIITTHPDIPYDDGIRRIYLYVNGDLPKDAGEDDRKLKNLLRYIGKSIKANVTDENTEKLDDIVHKTKAKKGIGVRFMK
ncbi:MAG: Rpn family recombination-promoting nuclease/putative transposase, partial [Lachnospiraceae bacterium]|nr:Rpn family recombination-promoting nuclease/putative transposase [Lachnospiraceae bacterium]